MPKKGRKSIGQSTAKVRKFRLTPEGVDIPSGSHENTMEHTEVTLDTRNVAVEMDTVLEAQPGTSGWQQKAMVVEQDVDIEPEP